MNRRYDLDWLRVFAVLLLVPFHSLLIFVLDPNSVVFVKDTINNDTFGRIGGFIHQFHMPLLFTISGSATYFALKLRSNHQYINERIKRLLIPLIFGVLFLVPPMTYISRLWRKENFTFFDHYINFFRFDLNEVTGLYGTFSPTHLWFILFLFVYSLLGLPIFRLLNRNDKFFDTFAKWLDRPLLPISLFIPILLFAALDILGDKNPLVYFTFFFYGFVLMTNSNYQSRINKDRYLLLILSITIEVIRQLTFYTLDEWSILWVLREITVVMNRWIFVLVILGFGNRYLNFNHPLLRYLSKSSFAFYILHLPINTLVGFFIIRLNTTVLIKYILIVFVTTILTFLMYELIRRLKPLHIFFGLK